MVKKIVGYADDNCKQKVFERDARDYDRSISNTLFGVTIGDVIRAVPIVVACSIFYANDKNFKDSQAEFNKQVINSVHENASAIGGIKGVLENLNNYLSATTGKQFRDGVPSTYNFGVIK